MIVRMIDSKKKKVKEKTKTKLTNTNNSIIKVIYKKKRRKVEIKERRSAIGALVVISIDCHIDTARILSRSIENSSDAPKRQI